MEIDVITNEKDTQIGFLQTNQNKLTSQLETQEEFIAEQEEEIERYKQELLEHE